MKKLLLFSMACIFANVFAFAAFTNVITPETPISASAEGNWGEVLEHLRDDDKDTKFTCFFTTEDGAFVQYELASAVVLYKHSIRVANDSPGRDPKDWALLGSHDGTDWAVLDEQENQYFRDRFETRDYIIRANTTAYKYYRLYVTDIIGSDQLSFADWNLFTESGSKTSPATLKITGNAVEAQNGLELGWKGSYYESYTLLKTGTYSFEGDNTLAGGTVTTDNNEATPYRIQVDYSSLPATVSVMKIEKMDVWAPHGSYTISDLTYDGEYTFKAEELIWAGETWGDDRYRVRIFFEADSLETYGARSSTSTYLVRTHNEQWGTVDEVPELNLHVPPTYTTIEKPFTIKVSFTPDAAYECEVIEYIPDGIPASLSIQGSALAESNGEAMLMKSDVTFFELFTSLSDGDYSFVGDAGLAGGTIDDIGEDPIACRIRVNYATDPVAVKIEKITDSYVWAAWKQYTVGMLLYMGNSTFKAENIICDTMEWTEGESDTEDRHRIKFDFDDFTVATYAPKDGEQVTQVGNDQWGSASDFNYSVEERYRNTGIPFNIIVKFSPTEGYSYLQEDYDPNPGPDPGDGLDKITVIADIYPTVVADRVNITLSKAGFEVELLSVSGNSVYNGSTSSESLTINGINVPAGIYLVKITQDGQLVSTKRVVKL